MYQPTRDLFAASILSSSMVLSFGVQSSTSLEPTITNEAFGHPGNPHQWTSARKAGVGTAVNDQSKVWFSLVDGIVSEVYWPQIDMAQITDLQLLVSDSKNFLLEEKQLQHQIDYIDDKSLAYQLTNKDSQNRFSITKKIITDPIRDVLIQNIKITVNQPNLKFYILLNPAISNTGLYDYAEATQQALYAWDDRIKHAGQQAQAAQVVALVSDIPYRKTSSGFVGKSDGWQDLADNFQMDWQYHTANNGNVALVAELDLPSKPGSYEFNLALGFGQSKNAAKLLAKQSLASGFQSLSQQYINGWNNYCDSLEDLSSMSFDNGKLYYTSAMVLKAHEDKTYKGGMIASLSIPWGTSQYDFQSGDDRGVIPGSPADGYKDGPVGYHVVWPRDLYQVATSMIAAGDIETAKRALKYLTEVQFKTQDGNWQFCENSVPKHGSFPQNFWLSGKPHWSGMQLDETAMPIILAWRLWQLGELSPQQYYQSFVKPAASFISRVGPWTQQERWEENSGISPSTTAAAITALIAAADFADAIGDSNTANQYRQQADKWVMGMDYWFFTRSGMYGNGSYYERIDSSQQCAKTANPNDQQLLYIANGGGQHQERAILDGGFLELVRFGIKSPHSSQVLDTLIEYDKLLQVRTPRGLGYYRYSHDGYGETLAGKDYTGEGKGRLWPLLTGERGHYELAKGNNVDTYIRSMENFANEGRMLPEQVWDQYTGPYKMGKGTGGATPLAWSHAEYIKLLASKQANQPLDTISSVVDRYQGCITTINVNADVGFNHQITIRGNHGPLNWDNGIAAHWLPGNTWQVTLFGINEQFKFKALKDDTHWQSGDNNIGKPCEVNTINPSF
ncbi:glycoside hydrolase family 15 protein [Spartinivicinus ruber]|uniref:glycoside hydrolase family 15 protein n=1 Tax=Spartinivicinus ruber TaxID=2683272 RepID=UPI0013D47DD8|nr:glycoside hydrolase family 15 protein [Spartinivicinus ruber]